MKKKKKKKTSNRLIIPDFSKMTEEELVQYCIKNKITGYDLFLTNLFKGKKQ